MIPDQQRACSPDATVARLAPMMEQIGVTRVGRLTGFDNTGIPVYQTTRPNARPPHRYGKGLSDAAAKASAMMEAMESWHAEQAPHEALVATLNDIGRTLPYDVYRLPMWTRHAIHDETALKWLHATTLPDERPTFIPRSAVSHAPPDTIVPLPGFRPTTVGLAGGNTREEASLRGLYELVERDGIQRWKCARRLNCTHVSPDTIHSHHILDILRRFREVSIDVLIHWVTSPIACPIFVVNVYSSDCPVICVGYGCHLDKEVSLVSALIEAAQSRAVVLAAGVQHGDAKWPLKIFRGHGERGSAARVDFTTVPTLTVPTVREQLTRIVDRIREYTNSSILAVELTNKSLNVPVMQLYAPGLLTWDGTH